MAVAGERELCRIGDRVEHRLRFGHSAATSAFHGASPAHAPIGQAIGAYRPEKRRERCVAARQGADRQHAGHGVRGDIALLQRMGIEARRAAAGSPIARHRAARGSTAA